MVTIVAHRGAPARAHENTVKSFLAAVTLGADMVELDVRKCGDGTLAVFHDPYLSRKTHSPLIANLSLSEINKRTAKQKFKVPRLSEAFEALAGKIMLNIELKEPGCEKEVLGLAQKYFSLDKFIITSFDPAIIVAVLSIAVKATAGLILATKDDLTRCDNVPAAVLAPEKKLFDSHRAFFADRKKQGKKIAIWTVDSTNDISRLIVDPIIDAIITNHPDKALALRNKLTNV